MKKSKIFILFAFVLILSSCSAFQAAIMTSSKMNKLELGMSKEQVTKILGSDYTIAEKRIEDSNRIEVLSYRSYYKDDEFYMFVFKNDKLEKWYRELVPKAPAQLYPPASAGTAK
jgi:Tfp pilus assembly protein PilF